MKNRIPESALKKHIAILGMNGSGKTSVAKSEIIEPVLAAGGRVCNIDPTGVGWGLRLRQSGAKGFDIYIVGGEHADFPLVRRDGKAWADIVGTTSDSFVFDTSQLTVEDRSQWFTDFAEALLRKNKGPLYLVLDEAHLFAPQGGAKSGGVAPRMLHATNNLLALGRSRGLRITMISQRAAKLHKDALTQAHTLVAMMMTSPQDRGAVKDWIADQADAETGKDIIASLPSLKPGEGWVWAPAEGILEKQKFALPKTFDSSAAPDAADGDMPSLPALNPEAIKAKLATVAKETVANDIPALKAEIQRLTLEFKGNGIDQSKVQEAYERGIKEGAGRAATELKAEMQCVRGRLVSAVQSILDGAANAIKIVHVEPRAILAPTPKPPIVMRTASPKPSNGHSASLPKAQGLILTALAQYAGGRTKNQVAILAGYAVNGGGFNNAISALRSADFISGSGDNLIITAAGMEALGDFDPLPTGDALLQHWLGQIGKAERAALAALARRYPDSASKEEVAAEAGYEPSGGGFNNALSRLRSLELIEGRGYLKASDALFG